MNKIDAKSQCLAELEGVEHNMSVERRQGQDILISICKHECHCNRQANGVVEVG